ncbi:MAG: PBP1A family penicillin-binding protein [Hyphomicrobiales bacterium]|nr:PBP1A family penicillin-binding protein [Hyphomicrobiales bacterium]
MPRERVVVTSFDRKNRRDKRGKKAQNGAKSKPPRRVAWFVLKWVTVATIWAVILTGGVVAWYSADLPDIETALAPTRKPSITVLSADGSTIGTVGEYYGRPVRVAELPQAVALAVLAIEDRRFYQHFGVDPVGILRAAWANFRAGSVIQGGSTITQQAAKNLFLSSERSMKRKIQELLLAFWLEHKFSKDQILAIYLNRTYFGAGAYGVDAASRKFFGRPATELNTYQAAMLAGLLKAPSRYNPINDIDAARSRADTVLRAMQDAGYLNESEARAAMMHGHAALPARHGRQMGLYFVDWITAQLPGYVGVVDRDLVVTTTLDPRLQRSAEQRVARILKSEVVQKSKVGQGALVAMSADGAVRAMVGGDNYWKSPFNRAVDAFRQPGSAFKPIVYLAGLEAGLQPDARFMDSPLQVAGWSPRNFSGRYLGQVTMARGLSESINTIAVQVSEYAGPRRVVDVAHRLGITANLQATPSLALGTSEVTLLELTAAYAVIANGGSGVWAYGIEKIHDNAGRILYSRSGSGPGPAITRRDAAAMTQMMVTAVEQGTGRAARFGRPVAGKTGTSQNFRDGWFIGFSSDLVTGVWMGNDNDKPMKGVTGGGLPAQLWRAFMADAHEGLPVQPLPSLTIAPPSAPLDDRPTHAQGGGSGEQTDFWDRLMRVFGG